MTIPVVCIMGPTASGKTRLALDIAPKLNAEIISVDSALVYRTMNIGTAKPSKEELNAVKHHLIDICDPSEAYSAGQFVEDAKANIELLHKHGKTPLLVGGTMLYFHALQQGVAELPQADETIRARLTEEGESKGWPAMHEQLIAIDPSAAQNIHPNDAQRIQRALEVYEVTGRPLSELQQSDASSGVSDYHFINIILAPEHRSELHALIEERFDKMLDQGLLDEVKVLYERGDLHEDLPAIRTVGYRQVWKHLTGEYDALMMRFKAIVATRQLAKRQFTWLRRWEAAGRFLSEDPYLATKVLEYIHQNQTPK